MRFGVTKVTRGRGDEPGQPLSILPKLALILIGYVMAVAAATVVTVGSLLALAVPSINSSEAARSLLTDGPFMVVIGFFWTFGCALPGFVVAVVLGELRLWRSWHVYALAGLLNVVPSLAISGVLAGSPLAMTDLLLSALPGGFAGGAAYWAGAGRVLAARR